MLLPDGSKLLAASEKNDLSYATLVPPFWMVAGPLGICTLVQGEPACIQGQLQDAGYYRSRLVAREKCPEGLSGLRRVSLAARTDLACAGLHDGDVMLLAALSGHHRRCGCTLLWE